MANPEDIERAKQGKDVWNAWANTEIAEGRRPEVDFSRAQIDVVDFFGFLFPGPALFLETIFPVGSEFGTATFSDNVYFGDATFLGGGQFQWTTFSGNANFNGVTFSGDVSFYKATFCAVGDFQRATFSGVASLEATFSDDALFREATFSKYAKFPETFLAYADFSEVEFHGDAAFNPTTFVGVANFTKVKFFDGAYFNDAKFRARVVFDEARFEGRRNDFVGAEFAGVPDLRTILFEVPLNLYGTKIPYQKIKVGTKFAVWRFWQRAFHCAADPEDAARYRRLKQLAGENNDHERELSFFAHELRAKRFYETTGFWPITLNVAYDWLSDYGRSIARPVVWLAATTGFAAMIVAFSRWYFPGNVWHKIAASVMLAATNQTLFPSADKLEIRKDAARILYGADTASFGFLGDALAWAQSGFSILLFFLIGLAIRNRFRVGGGG